MSAAACLLITWQLFWGSAEARVNTPTVVGGRPPDPRLAHLKFVWMVVVNYSVVHPFTRLPLDKNRI